MPVFPDTVAYLFERQLAEADVILLNKIELLPNKEQDRLVAHLAERFPSAEILPISALTGAGLDPWLETSLRRTVPAIACSTWITTGTRPRRQASAG